MALNLYKVRVFGGLILGPLIAVIAFFVGLSFYGFLWGLVGMAIGLMISVLIGKLMIKNPFSDMLEGKGILALNVDSTGIIRPFVVAVQSPYIRNVKEGVDDVFDREAVFQLAVPENARVPLQALESGGVRVVLDKKGMMKLKEIKADGFLELNKDEFRVLEEDKKKIRIALNPDKLEELKARTKENITILDIDEDEYNKGRFALFHYPCLLYNDQTQSIITKDFLAEQEKEAFAEHGILYLNRKMQELTSVVRDFGRAVVELLKPSSGLMTKWWVWIIIAVVVAIIIAMFAPAVINAVKNMGGAGGGAVSSAVGAAKSSGATITPVG